ncbi:HCCA isomerase/glutathione S-transferase kappa [Rhizodiscina lignyota]|uniref:Glutathione S-transferase kappa n=1 Tax=Rhizodiscina lignyota TaxID=1504668 RepID=A0A9P4IF80_9PEZI|nr:HCCA isomerase/glutathione S-transferase kappa [Rhizodiscina lignyota]
MARPKITMFVDIVSPFAYMGYYALRNFPVFKQCDIEYIPILLGGLMKTCGNTAPLFIKNKDKWIGKERNRWATYLEIPINRQPVPGFPVSTVPVQRALCAIQMSEPEKLAPALDALYTALWVNHAEIAKPDVIQSVLSSAIGEKSAAAAVKGTGNPDVKKRLIQNTDDAFTGDAFGLPWFICTNRSGEKEGFWGVDHLAQVVDFLGLERPTSKGWRALL